MQLVNAVFCEEETPSRLGKEKAGPSYEVNLADCQDFVVTVLTHLVNSVWLGSSSSWIVDSGASTHVCGNLAYFDTQQPVKSFTPVHLPDNFVKSIKSIGVAKLSDEVVLVDCLHMPSFKCNLHYVSMLSKSASIHDVNISVSMKQPCVVSPLVKQQRISFSKSVSTTNESFHLIHVDLLGP
ncbi:hypothetical protein LIER_12383 [Lithospermum erythrorhizon]|uniref:Retrovirus-related Pol polyprotein from transposon TNT 1-94-like beta-barrel domain-containing protein n=1 Tax=Lithospermum erythrorhizon TaxID=34254 RepID=A0AAV3PRJ3_LITER